MLYIVGEADAAKETRKSRGLMQPRAGAPRVCPCAQKLLGKSSAERAGKRIQTLDKTEVDSSLESDTQVSRINRISATMDRRSDALWWIVLEANRMH